MQQGLTAIDEPELHLHPAAQSALGHTLAASGRQHILATHSGRVAAAFKPTEVVCLSQNRPARHLPQGHEVASDLFVWRWWNSELVEALTSECVLFVEGASDRIIVQAVAEASGIRLAQLGAHIVELDGAGTFARAIGVLGDGGYGIPTFGLCDLDAQDDWASALGVEASDISGLGYKVCVPDLEGEVVSALGVDRFVALVTKAPFMSKQSLLTASGASRLEDIGETEAAEYWRRPRNKIAVATAIAVGITQADTAKLETIASLLTAVRHD